VHNGSPKIVYPSVYMNTCVEYKEESFLASYSLSLENSLTKRLQEATVEVLKHMDSPPSYSFHVELWHTPSDKLAFCEAACRTGGAGVAGVMLQLFETNLNKASIQGQCMDPVTSPLPDHWNSQKHFPSSSSSPSSPSSSSDSPPPSYTNVGWIVVYPSPGTVLHYPKDCPLHFVLEYEPANTLEWGPDCRVHCTNALGSFLVTGKSEENIRKNIEETVHWYLKEIKWQQ